MERLISPKKNGDLGGGLWYPKNGELDPTFGNAPPLDAPGHSDKKADRHVCIFIYIYTYNMCVYVYPDIYFDINSDIWTFLLTYFLTFVDPINRPTAEEGEEEEVAAKACVVPLCCCFLGFRWSVRIPLKILASKYH